MVATNYKGSDTVTKIVDLLGTSVDENSLEGINLVSNPVTSVISFENKLTEEVEFYLFDVSGKLVVNEIVSGDFSVSAEQLPSGIYFAELRSEGKTFRAKVMKQ